MRKNVALIFTLLVVTVFSLLLACSIYYGGDAPRGDGATPGAINVESNNVRRALLVDGLSDLYPGDAFINAVKGLLEESGYVVSVVRGLNVTVGFLMGLERYDIVVLRLHSAISLDGVLYLFTGEPYNDDDYLSLRLTGVVAMGDVRIEDKKYFALNARYLAKNSAPNLTGSIVVLMGCDGTKDRAFIKGLLSRGVAAYIAWDGYVSIEHSDKATLEFIKVLVRGGLSPEEAVNRAMEVVGPDPVYGAVLRCFVKREGSLS